MPASTPVYGFPYPLGTDRVMDGDNAIGALALAIEALIESRGRRLGYALATANQINIVATPIDLTGLSVTVNLPAGRVVKVSGHVWLQSATVGTDVGRVTIMEGATTLQVGTVTNPSTNASSSGTSDPFVILTPPAGAHTYKLQAARIFGTGSITLQASPTSPAIILVEDLGAV